MYTKRMRILLVLLAAAAALTRVAMAADVPSPQQVERNLPRRTPPAWMQTDLPLQEPMRLDVKGGSLAVLLNNIRMKTGVDVSAASSLREFRVFIQVESQPLARVMERLEDVLSHGSANLECQWRRIEGPEHSLRYILERTPSGKTHEAALLNKPMTTATQWLRDLRSYSRLPPDERSQFKSDWPYLQGLTRDKTAIPTGSPGQIARAVASLTDRNIATLCQTGHVDLPGFALAAEEVAQVQQAETATQQRLSDLAVRRGLPPINQPVDRTPPGGAQLRLRSDSAAPGPGFFILSLSFQTGFPRHFATSFFFDTLRFLPGTSDDDIAQAAQETEEGPVVDLLSGEQSVPGEQPAMSLVTALRLLAREARITLYSEVFLKRSQVLRFTKGKPEYLLTRLCQTFGCEWRKSNGDYVVWSKTWAQDRAADVPQPRIDRWVAAYWKEGRFRLSDYREMVQLNDLQLPTIEMILGIRGPLAAGNRHALRLLNTMNGSQIRHAYGIEGGFINGSLHQEADNLAQVFSRNQIVPPVRVKLEQQSKGVSVTFADQLGFSRAFWLYEGDKIKPGEKPQWLRSFTKPVPEKP